MVTVAEVDMIIAREFLDLGTTDVALSDSAGRTLKQDIFADRDFPPFDRAMMDGIAIQFEAWQKGLREFRVEGLCAAGTSIGHLDARNGCLEIMTGSVLPTNTDTIVKYELVTITNGVATIDANHIIKKGQHIHRQATDRNEGELLLEKNRVISAAEIAVMATVGMAEVTVARLPRVAVVATGDELVDVDKDPLPHQIRKSNVYSLIAGLRDQNFQSEAFHFTDDKEALRTGLEEILKNFDVVILSGGVSKGKLDYVPDILSELGVAKEFHFVKQRPGKPFWFGRYKKGVVFALPGNPISTFIGLLRYVIPFLWRSAGVEPKAVKAMLTEDFTFKPDLTYHLQVRLSYDGDGRVLATPVPGQGSGDLANLLEADAFIELPEGRDEFKVGEVFRSYGYR
jgi:molybdopterin molybdotransferase